jgi:hypothetical protein
MTPVLAPSKYSRTSGKLGVPHTWNLAFETFF